MVTWTLDTIPPSAEFKGTLPENYTTRSNAEIQFETNDYLSGVHSVECQLDKGAWEVCESGETFQASLHSRTFFTIAVGIKQYLVYVHCKSQIRNILATYVSRVW